MEFINVCEPTLAGKELEYVIDCIKTNWISSAGKYIEQFEKQFAAYCNTKHGIAVSNGLAALHLALAACGIGKGDEVIIPDFTIISNSFAITYLGAKPVLVDVDPKTWCIDVKKIEEKITKNTKAIMPVHMYGHPCDMDPIMEIAKKHNLLVIEDAAEVHGAEYKGRKVGCFGDAGCFSFFANKIITTGEGGMVITNNDKIAEKARIMRNVSHSPKKRYLHEMIGFNYRLTNLQAAIGVAQLENIEKYVDARRNHAKLYNSLLKNVKGITLPAEEKWAKNVYWMYSILIQDDFGMARDELQKKLREKGIDTRTFFIPTHAQPVFEGMDFTKGSYPVSDEISRKGLYLPSSSSLTEEQIRFICDTIKAIQESF